MKARFRSRLDSVATVHAADCRAEWRRFWMVKHRQEPTCPDRLDAGLAALAAVPDDEWEAVCAEARVSFPDYTADPAAESADWLEPWRAWCDALFAALPDTDAEEATKHPAAIPPPPDVPETLFEDMDRLVCTVDGQAAWFASYDFVCLQHARAVRDYLASHA